LIVAGRCRLLYLFHYYYAIGRQDMIPTPKVRRRHRHRRIRFNGGPYAHAGLGGGGERDSDGGMLLIAFVVLVCGALAFWGMAKATHPQIDAPLKMPRR
jgi:hypothetical protein